MKKERNKIRTRWDDSAKVKKKDGIMLANLYKTQYNECEYCGRERERPACDSDCVFINNSYGPLQAVLMKYEAKDCLVKKEADQFPVCTDLQYSIIVIFILIAKITTTPLSSPIIELVLKFSTSRLFNQ